MIEENATKNYLLDYRTGGDLGPMRIISISFAVDADSYDMTMEWLREKILRNEREFTMGEYGPFKEEPQQVQVYPKEPSPSGLRTYADGEIMIGNPYDMGNNQNAGINPPNTHL